MANVTVLSNFTYSDGILNMTWDGASLLTDNPCMNFIECADFCTQHTVITLHNDIVMMMIGTAFIVGMVFIAYIWLNKSDKMQYFLSVMVLAFGAILGMMIYVIQFKF